MVYIFINITRMARLDFSFLFSSVTQENYQIIILAFSSFIHLLVSSNIFYRVLLRLRSLKSIRTNRFEIYFNAATSFIFSIYRFLLMIPFMFNAFFLLFSSANAAYSIIGLLNFTISCLIAYIYGYHDYDYEFI